MIKFNRILKITIVLFIVSTVVVLAQDAPELDFRLGGTVQAWTTSGQINGSDTNSLGWGIRRARLRAYANYGSKLKGFLQMEVASPKLIDARVEFLISKSFSVRAGRFVGASVRSGALTSHTKLDITERSLTAMKWAKATVGGDYRDYGIDFVGNFGDLKANVTLHNGSGSLNIKNSHKGYSFMNGGFAISGMLVFKPQAVKGLEAGTYYGIGNPDINKYYAYNAYIYYIANLFKIKAEYITWKNTYSNIDISQMGYHLFTGYRVGKYLEAGIRYEHFDSNTDIENNERNLITLALTYSVFPSKWNVGKITAAYVISGETGTEIDDNVFQLAMQVVF